VLALVRSWWVLPVLLLSPCTGAADAADSVWDAAPLIETIDDQDSIPDDNVTALAEDRDGFLWIGTTNGLLRYDGYRFRRYVSDRDDPRSISGGFVRTLLARGDGSLWVGTSADGVSIRRPDGAGFERVQHRAADPASLSDNAVRALAEAADGSVWIGTLNGLNRVDPSSGAIERWPGGDDAVGPSDNRVLAIHADRAGNLWVGSWLGLDVLRPGAARFTRVRPTGAVAASLVGESVRAIVETATGELWVSTLGGALLVIDPQTLHARAAPAANDDFVLLTGVSTDGRTLWLGGLGGMRVVDAASGLERLRLQYDPAMPSGLGTSDIRAVLVDRAGQLWMGGYGGGLQRYNARNRAIRMLRHRPGDATSIGGPSISSMVELADGRLLVGTRGQGIDLLDDRLGVVDRLLPGRQGLDNGVVTALAVDREGTLWIGTDQGLSRSEFPRSHALHSLSGLALPSNTIRRLRAAEKGVWVGTNGGLVWVDAGGRHARTILQQHGEPLRVDINAIELADDGRLWVGAATGLYTIAPGSDRLRALEAAPGSGAGLSHRSVVGLLLDRDGQLWIDTAQGLNRLRRFDDANAEFEDASAAVGIGGQPFGANLLQDAEGRIWSHRFVLDSTAGTVVELLRADGADLGTGWFRSYAQRRDGSLLFGGTRGIMRIGPQQFAPWDYSPPLVISESRITGREIVDRTPAGLVLPASRQGMSVEYAALDFSAPSRNRYSHRLVGFDDDWIDSDASRRTASYSNLWPGRYVLEVRGSNRAGVWSDETLTLPVQVEPRFWQTGAFAVLLLATLVSVTLWLSRLRSSRLARRAAQLEQLVELRTGELTRSKQNAEQALADLRETQQQLLVAEKMAALGQLVAGVAHEINTPLGVALTAASLVSERTEALAEKLDGNGLRRSDLQQFLESTRAANALVDHNLARAAHLVRTFKQVSADRSSDECRDFDLAGYLSALFESLAPGLAAQAITYRLDCEPGITMHSFPGSLGQVIGNLASNAMQHAFAGGASGEIVVRCRRAPGDHVLIEFHDDGAGIAADLLARVFEPFFTTQRAQGRTGLGLHIAFNIVTVRLEGSLTVDSTPGRGSCFRLRLPRVVVQQGV